MEKTRDPDEIDPEATPPELPNPTHPLLELKSERVQRELATLRGWQATDQADGIELHLRFPSPGLTYAFLAAFAETASEEAPLNPQLVLIGKAVGITLVHPDGAGIASSQLRFARTLADHPASLAGRPIATAESP